MEPGGAHVFADYSGVFPRDGSALSAESIFASLVAATEASGVRVVGQLLSVFDGSVSPLGFAAVVLIDESHVSAHSYADEGLLAVDAFTCGGTNPDDVLDDFIARIAPLAPDMVTLSRQRHDRFLRRRAS